jgi:very-short-patch-repair endonuclease
MTRYAHNDPTRPLMPVELICRADGLPMPVPEFRFDACRRFRFDWAWVPHKIALEVDGGVWAGGRHTRGAGFMKDQEKTNLAALHGWRVFRCTPQTIHTAMALVRQALQREASA